MGFAILPAFALANAGVRISISGLHDPVPVAIAASLVLGKPVGVMALSWLAVRLGLATRPAALSWPVLGAGTLLTGIGFTMSLFIAGLAFPPALLDAAKIGILGASLVSATAGLSALAWLGRGHRPVGPGPARVSEGRGSVAPMEIPIDSLSEAALRGVIEAFVNREGTDYGEVETPFERKVEQVRVALLAGRARLTFDEGTETCNIVPVESQACPRGH